MGSSLTQLASNEAARAALSCKEGWECSSATMLGHSIAQLLWTKEEGFDGQDSLSHG